MEQKTVNALALCPLFKQMSDTEIEDALRDVSHKVITFEKHEIYAIAGFSCNHADIMLRGEMTARMIAPSGKQVEVIRLSKGDVIAPNFIFSDEHLMPVTIETESKVSILRMSPNSLRHLVDTHEKIRWNFIYLLSNIGAFLAEKVKFLSLLTIKEKVKFFLLSEVRAQGKRTITLNKSRQHLADAFAIQKFSLIRCLAELVEDGCIEIHGKEITIYKL